MAKVTVILDYMLQPTKYKATPSVFISKYLFLLSMLGRN